MTSSPLFQNNFNLRRARVDNFADIIKIAATFIKTALKDSNAIYCNLYLYFLIQQKLLISGKKMLMSSELKGCGMRDVIHIYCGSSLTVSVPSFIIVGYV